MSSSSAPVEVKAAHIGCVLGHKDAKTAHISSRLSFLQFNNREGTIFYDTMSVGNRPLGIGKEVYNIGDAARLKNHWHKNGNRFPKAWSGILTDYSKINPYTAVTDRALADAGYGDGVYPTPVPLRGNVGDKDIAWVEIMYIITQEEVNYLTQGKVKMHEKVKVEGDEAKFIHEFEWEDLPYDIRFLSTFTEWLSILDISAPIAPEDMGINHRSSKRPFSVCLTGPVVGCRISVEKPGRVVEYFSYIEHSGLTRDDRPTGFVEEMDDRGSIIPPGSGRPNEIEDEGQGMKREDDDR